MCKMWAITYSSDRIKNQVGINFQSVLFDFCGLFSLWDAHWDAAVCRLCVASRRCVDCDPRRPTSTNRFHFLLALQVRCHSILFFFHLQLSLMAMQFQYTIPEVQVLGFFCVDRGLIPGVRSRSRFQLILTGFLFCYGHIHLIHNSSPSQSSLTFPIPLLFFNGCCNCETEWSWGKS